MQPGVDRFPTLPTSPVRDRLASIGKPSMVVSVTRQHLDSLGRVSGFRVYRPARAYSVNPDRTICPISRAQGEVTDDTALGPTRRANSRRSRSACTRVQRRAAAAGALHRVPPQGRRTQTSGPLRSVRLLFGSCHLFQNAPVLGIQQPFHVLSQEVKFGTMLLILSA